MQFVRIAVACAIFGTLGCATLFTGTTSQVSINSSPPSANVTIKRLGGDVTVKTGMTPMTAKLPKGKEYEVTIHLQGYKTETVSITKEGVSAAAFLNLASLLGWVIDYATGAMFKLGPNEISVRLTEVTSHEGRDSIYAVVTIVDEDGVEHQGAIEMVKLEHD